MKFEKLELVKDFLTVQMDYWVLFSGALTLLILQGDRPEIVRWGLLSLYPFLLYLIRRADSNFFAFTGSHLVLAACLLLLPAETVLVRGLFDGYVLGYTAYSFYLRMNTKSWQDQAIPPMVAVGILAVMLIILYTQEKSSMEAGYILLGVVYLCIYFLYNYIVQYLHFVRVNESSAGYIPVKKMFFSGLRMILPYSITCGILLLLLGNTSLITTVAGVVKRALAWILSLLLRGAGSDEGYTPEESVAAVEQEMPSGEAFPVGESFWLWEVLEKVGMLLVAVLAVWMAVKVLREIIRFLKKVFARSMGGRRKLSEELVDKREKCEVEREIRSKNKKRPLFVLSNREKIRKIYKKKIEAAKKREAVRPKLSEEGLMEKELQEKGTARECLGVLQAMPLAEVYEKARYSELACTGEDVKEARKWQ